VRWKKGGEDAEYNHGAMKSLTNNACKRVDAEKLRERGVDTFRSYVEKEDETKRSKT